VRAFRTRLAGLAVLLVAVLCAVLLGPVQARAAGAVRSKPLKPGLVSSAARPDPKRPTQAAGKPGDAWHRAVDQFDARTRARGAKPAPAATPPDAAARLSRQRFAADKASGQLPAHVRRGPRQTTGPAMGSLHTAAPPVTAVPRTPAARVLAAQTSTVYGASYTPETPFVVQPAYDTDGAIWVTVKNTSTATWAASQIGIAYHLYRSDGTVYDYNGYATVIPVPVAPGNSVRLQADVERLPAGSFKLYWDAELLGTSPSWFSAHSVPLSTAVSFTLAHRAPTGQLVYPTAYAVVSTLTPLADLTVSGDKTQPLQAEFQLCEDAAATVNCRDSGWLSVTTSDSFEAAENWQVPTGAALKWNTTYYLRARVKDSLTTSWSSAQPFTTVVAPATGGAQYGVDPSALDPAGVNLFAGNYTRTDTDLKVPVSNSSQPLQISRTYNSANTASGAFGTGWSSILDAAIDPTPEGWVKATFQDGHQLQYGENPDGSWSASYGAGSSVTYQVASGGVPWLKFSDGTQEEFSPAGGHQPVKNLYSTGPSVLSFTSTGGHITQISENISHRAIKLTWTGSHVTAATAVDDTGASLYSYTYTYSGNQLTQVCDADGECTGYAYGGTDSSHTVPRLTTVTRAVAGHTLKLTYSGDYLSTLQTPSDLVSGGSDTWHYYHLAPTQQEQESGVTSVVQSADPTGVNVYYGFDDWGSLLSRWTGASTPQHGSTRSWQYDSVGRVIALMDENDNLTEYTWDSISGKLSDENRYRDTTGTIVNTHYTYDSTPFANLLTVTDADHHTTTTTYSGERLHTRTTPPTASAPQGATTSYAYTCESGTDPAVVNDPGAPAGSLQPCGLIASVKDPDGHTTSYGYDRFGDQTLVHLPTGGYLDSAFDTLGQVSSVTASSIPGGSGYTTHYRYDNEGRTRSEVGDSLPNPLQSWSDEYSLVSVYDADGNLVSKTEDDDSDTEGAVYDARVQTYTYDARDLLASTSQDGQVLSRQTYDGAGHVVDSWDADNAHYHYVYDSRGQLNSVWQPEYSDAPGTSAPTRSVRIQAYGYDNAGRLSDYWDPMGHVVAYTYTNDDLLLTETYVAHADDPSDPDQTRDVLLNSYSYDPAGNMTGDTEGSGATARTTAYAYDADNQRTSITVDPAGLDRQTSYQLDPAGLVLSTSLTDGTRTETTTNAYDPTSGLLLRTAVHNDATPDLVTQYTRDSYGRVLTVTDPRGVASLTSTAAPDPAYTTSYTYDALGRVSTVTGPAVAVENGNGTAPATTRPVTSYAYDSYGELVQEQDAVGGETYYGYDTRGNLTATRGPDSWQRWTYDNAGNATSTGDSVQGTRNFTYDSRNRPRTQTRWDPVSGSAQGTYQYAWDDDSNLLSTTTPTGAQTLYGYDDMDRNTSVDQVVRNGTATPDQDVTQTRYDDFGEPTHSWQTTNGRTYDSYQGYDAAGELSSSSETGRGTTQYQYDVAGRQTLVTDPLGHSTETDYDLAGRPTAVVAHDVDGTVLARTDYTTDPAGNVTGVRDPDRNLWQASYDAGDRLTTLTDPAPTAADGTTTAAAPVTSFGYDAVGDATRMTDADQQTTYQTYAPGGDLLTRVEPATPQQPAAADRTWTWHYTNGSVTSATEPGGVADSYSYDGFDQLTGVSATGGEGGAASRSYGYDQDGRLTGVGVPGGTQTLTYDDRGLLTGSTGPEASSSFAYDALGRLTSETSAAGTVGYGYIGLEDVGTASDPLTGDLVDYTHDLDGQVTQVADHSSEDGLGPVRTLVHDGLGRVTSDSTVPEDGTSPTVSLGYTWDANGNLMSSTSSGNVAAPGTTGYQYDQDNRLIRTTAPGSTPSGTDDSWDAVGNRTATTPWTGSAHTPTGAGSTSQYDARDRLTATTGAAGSTAYTWSARGTLANTTVTAGGSSSSSASTFDSLDRLVGNGGTSYAYDSLDRIASVTDGTGTRAFAYAGTSAEPSSDGVWRYARTADDSLISAQRTGGDPERLVQDVHQNVVAELGLDFGNTLADRSYDPFGGTAASSGSAAAVPPVGFQGGWTDPGSDLVSAESRWYSPGTGTFASADSAPPAPSTAAGTNDYLYGGGDPTSYLDTNGHWSVPGLGSVLDGVDGALNGVISGLGDVGSGVEAAGPALLDGAEAAGEFGVGVAASPELLAAGVVVGLAGLGYGVYQLAHDDPDTGQLIGAPPVNPVTGPGAPPVAPPPHPAKPVVIGTATKSTTTSWQTVTKWQDQSYLYTRTDHYSYTTTQQWTYYSDGTDAYQWWRSATVHTWTITVQPRVAATPDVNPDQEGTTKSPSPAPNTGPCRTGADVARCAPTPAAAPLPDGAVGDGGDGGGGSGTPPAPSCSPDPSPDSTGDGPWVDPRLINFSQRTVTANNYLESMLNGTWDWNQPGTALTVIERGGQLVSYDNRRLFAARQAREVDPDYRAKVEQVDPSAPNPAKTTGKSWDQSFEQRMTSKRNQDENGCRVPWQGRSELPEVEQ
jgi:RHS repeat-associated protein